MARNQVTRRPRRSTVAEAPPQSKRSIPVVPILLAAGAALAIGVPFMARVSTPHKVLPPHAPLQLAVASPLEVQSENPAAPPADTTRSFLDDGSAGAAAYATGDFEAALKKYQDAIVRNPDDAEAESNLGQVLVRLGHPAEALPHFDRAIALIQGRWAYHFNRARALKLLGRLDESIASYRTVQQLLPDDYATIFNIGQILHQKGDEAAAVQEYLKAITLNPDDGTFRLALGISLERLQKRAEAAAAYGEYLRLSPQSPDAEKVKARIAQLTAPAS
jgi:tetratricopeptide (TPR) repeat protein